MIQIYTLQVGQPQTITDEQGEYRSSIFRQPVTAPVYLTLRGLEGDQVADTRHHGSPGQAVCCQPLVHYDFWNEYYHLEGERRIAPGATGENWTLSGITEQEICIGDIFAVGEARVQVSGSRYPCSIQSRKLRLPDFHLRVLETLRTGFYLRVLQPGVVQVGQELTLLERPYPLATLHAANRCALQGGDDSLAEMLLAIPLMDPFWAEKIKARWHAGG